MNDGGPAFPARLDDMESGMTLRDYFAAKAMRLAQVQDAYNTRPNETSAAFIARHAYALADAMLKERDK